MSVMDRMGMLIKLNEYIKQPEEPRGRKQRGWCLGLWRMRAIPRLKFIFWSDLMKTVTGASGHSRCSLSPSSSWVLESITRGLYGWNESEHFLVFFYNLSVIHSVSGWWWHHCHFLVFKNGINPYPWWSDFLGSERLDYNFRPSNHTPLVKVD